MQPGFTSDSVILQVTWSVGILLVSVLVAWLLRWIVRYLEKKLVNRRDRQIRLPEVLDSLIKPLVVLIVSEGVIFALSSVPALSDWSDILGKAKAAVRVLGAQELDAMVTYALATGGGVLLAVSLRSASRRRVKVDEGVVRLLRRTILLIVSAVGILVLLDYLNVSITPIITGLGIGGLAVALALQPTLGNFFAGTQIVSDRVVRVGDYIELEGDGIKGYVTDVGWRSTRVRTPQNNLVIIPNSRLAESIVTNYFGPTMEMAVIVNCGVSYNASLVEVERISLEVAEEVVAGHDGADKSFKPWFAYEEFGDSNINFWIWLQAKDRISSFRVKSEIIKLLKARLDKAGITINYPARLLTFDDATMPPAFRAARRESGSVEEKQ